MDSNKSEAQAAKVETVEMMVEQDVERHRAALRRAIRRGAERVLVARHIEELEVIEQRLSDGDGSGPR